MTKLLRHRIAALALLVALPIGMTACDFSGLQESVDNFGLKIQLEQLDTYVVTRVIDVNTERRLNVPATIRFSGDDANQIVDVFNDPVEKQEASNGLVTFGLAKGVIPADGSPVEFRVSATAQNYQTVSQHVAISDTGTVTLTLRMVNIEQPPPGAETAKAQISTDANGATTQATTAQTQTSPTTSSSAAVTVRQGTVMEDEDGQPLTGQVAVTVTHFGNETEESQDAMPTCALVDESGQEEDAAMATLSFTAINVADGSGNRATRTNKPLDVRIALSDNTSDPTTGAPLQANDRLEVRGYFENEGVWKKLGEADVLPADGKTASSLQVSFQIPEGVIPSTSALGKRLQTCGIGADGANFSIALNGNQEFDGKIDIPKAPNITFEVGGIEETGTFNRTLRQLLAQVGLSGQVKSLPDVDVEVELTTDGGSVSQTMNLCTGNGSFQLPAPPTNIVNNVRVQAEIRCNLISDDLTGLTIMMQRMAPTEGKERTVSTSKIKQDVQDGKSVFGWSANNIMTGATYRFEASFGEFGPATVEFTVPADAQNGQTLVAEDITSLAREYDLCQ